MINKYFKMKSRIFLCALMSGIFSFGQETEDNDSIFIELNPVEIIHKLPLSSERITKKQLEQKNLGPDIPQLLQNSTSVVNTSDAGAGIGYSSIRIRGVDQSHINISMNGVSLNDAESQRVFWVNMPDLASQVSSISIQRGVGTSASGTGTFGANIQIESTEPSRDLFLESNNSWGSFGTQKYSLKAGTGEFLNNKLRVDLNASLIKSDGYIDRAFSDLFSWGINAQYDINERSSIRYWTFYGKEKTYQAWNGIDRETMKNNRTFNSAGAIYNDAGEIIDYYDNETDNYRQHHNHLIWDQSYGKGWQSNTTLYYTRGKGFYDNYRQNARLNQFKINSDLERADLIRQKWLDNHSYGLNFNLVNQRLGDWKIFTGFAINQYENKHYGKVTWVKGIENHDPNWEFYRNKSIKNEVSAYAKALYQIDQFELFGDIQYRYVNYETKADESGMNEYENFFAFKDDFNFINPKIGLNYNLTNKETLYFFYGLAHREPIRSDYLDNGKKLNPEKLHDFELGFRSLGRLTLNANLYYMYYLDQLVATGQLNETGNYIRTNSGKSYRTGIELNADYGLIENKLNLFGNLTYSINKNLDYSEIAYDEDWNEILQNHGDTEISFSPNWIGVAGLEYRPVSNLLLNISNKYVGSQYMTNTEIEDSKLDAYFLTDLVIRYSPNWFNLKNLSFSLLINNLFDQEYESNGFYYEGPYYYPQAGINILGGISFRL